MLGLVVRKMKESKLYRKKNNKSLNIVYKDKKEVFVKYYFYFN